VLVGAAFGAFFLGAPGVALRILEIRPSAEAAALFQLYGTLLIARALAHRALFRIPDPTVQRRMSTGDVFYSGVTALLLGRAVLAGLAGSAAWAAVAIFTAELALHAWVRAGLHGVSRADLEGALAAARAASGPRAGPDAA
jgi:hypothetical protein